MIIESHKKSHMLTVSGAVLALFAIPAGAQALSHGEKLTAKPAMPKMVKTFGGMVPQKGSGAVIRVYGSPNGYEGIADLTKTTGQPWIVEARAPVGRQISESWIKIGNKGWTVFENSKAGIRGHGPRTIVTNLTIGKLDIGMDPVAACNSELNMRSARSGNSKAQILKQGFVLKVDDAIRGEAKMRHYVGLRKPHTKAIPISAPVYISCLGDIGAGKNPLPTPKPRPGPPSTTPRPGHGIKVAMDPVSNISEGTVNKNSLYFRKCPLQARFQASITSPRAFTVRYRYVGNGWESTIRQKQLQKGTQKLPVYTKWVGKAKSGGVMKLKSAKNKPDYTGWAAVEIIRTGDNLVSKRRNYKIYCSEKPKRAPSKPKVMKLQPAKIAVPNSERQ